MNLHYFDNPEKAILDYKLASAIDQGYVPQTCLLAGMLVLHEVTEGRDPCAGCEGTRFICQGRAKMEGQK